jgi:predicted deacetylase
MDARRHPALLSIHDVMPETLARVRRLRDLCIHAGPGVPSLLVVPGRNWDRDGIATLRDWQQEGSELIAHGWHHHTRPRRLFHRVHAALLSRNVAEHLDLDRQDIVSLMQRSHDWFPGAGLEAPSTYIPPAWALGLPADRLRELPYRCIEVLRGIILVSDESVRHRRLPLLGFEADTPLRAHVLRAWNRRQLLRARREATPLRISIHPHDDELMLADDLRSLLGQSWQTLTYASLVP